jgi:hypothetical protein
MVAAAIAIPLGGIAVTAVTGSAVAGATPLAITCHLSAGTVTFATPGLSGNGSITSATTSSSSTSAETLSCGSAGTGSSSGQSIVTDNTACTGTNAPEPGCTLGQYSYDTVGGFTSGSSTLWTRLSKFKFKIGTTTYKAKSSSSKQTVCGGIEGGFVIKGKLTAPAAHAGEATKLVVCFSGDSGSHTTDNFTTDFGNASSNPLIVIATAGIDPTLSKVKIS